MATTYPGSIDVYTVPLGTETLGGSTPTHRALVKDITDALTAIETELGANPSDGATSYATVAARLAAIEAASGTSIINNVKSNGAVGNGTTDDTTAVNTTITNAAANGGTVYFPPGTYSLNNITLKAGVRYEGIRGKSILQIRTGALYLASCDSGSASAFISSMTFTGLTFRGRIDTDTTFDEQRHLLNLNGVQDVFIYNNDFIGWHGDAIYLGSSNSAGTERHNQRVVIAFNSFDGLTKNNRNCVSIIDGEDITVLGNVGKRFSRSDMPGFVDVEPNPANGPFAICRRITVTGNKTSDHNQNFFQMNLTSASYTNEPKDIIVANNSDDAGAANASTRFAYLAYPRATTDSSSWTNVKIVNNTCRNSYEVFETPGGVCGVDLIGNTFENCAGAGVLGWWNQTQVRQARHIRIENNTFINCGSNDGNVFRVEQASNVAFVNNKFHNCVGNLVRFALGENGTSGTSADIDWISNQITGTGTTSISSLASGHTLSASSNRRRAYRENGLTILTAHFGTLV